VSRENETVVRKRDSPFFAGGGHAALVASGILLSRLFGLVRASLFARYFGQRDAADAFNAAIRIPNLLQNLFGEGALSASFIPVYARLVAEGDEEEAGRVAGAILRLLALTVSIVVAVGVLVTPFLITLIAPGFEGEKRDLTIRLVRILFPGAGILVLSAWCLGILNSHRRFFLSYASPVIWNVAMIATLVIFGNRLGLFPLAEAVAWGSVVGTALQFGIQLPLVLRLVRRLRLSASSATRHVRIVLTNVLPAFLSRGVVQISGYVDQMIASLLPEGAVAALANAQMLYLLPVSLFGMSVSAAELPAMSSASGDDEAVRAHLRQRLDAGLRQIAFFVVPSVVAFLALGDVVAAAIYEHGRFTHADALWVWAVLAGSSVGLLASTLGRLYTSSYYALRDTRTPMRFAVLRVCAAAGLAYVAATRGPALAGIDARWGVAGVTMASGTMGWVELTLLRRGMTRRVGRTGLPAAFVTQLWIAALVAAALAWAIKLALGRRDPQLVGVLVLAPYALAYLAIALALRVDEARALVRRLR
jgi:putative peptidoglycan lipid II flippase